MTIGKEALDAGLKRTLGRCFTPATNFTPRSSKPSAFAEALKGESAFGKPLKLTAKDERGRVIPPAPVERFAFIRK
jgi:hypothetical protein